MWMAIVCGKRAHEHTQSQGRTANAKAEGVARGVGEASRGVREDILNWWLY
jgi:hypothetical protein